MNLQKSGIFSPILIVNFKAMIRFFYLVSLWVFFFYIVSYLETTLDLCIQVSILGPQQIQELSVRIRPNGED